MKERVSLTLDKNVVERIDGLVDGIAVKSRSHAVEKILCERLAGERVAVILCGGSLESLCLSDGGGRGARTLKALARIDGGARGAQGTLIEFQLAKCRESGFTRVIIAGNKTALAQIHEALGDGEKLGVTLEYVQEERALGDARTLELVRERVKTSFLVIPCDYFFTFDLRKLFDFHIKNGGVATLAVYAGGKHPSRASCFAKMDGSQVTELGGGEKIESAMVATLAFAAKPDLFDFIPRGGGEGGAETRCSMRDDVLPKLAREGKLMGYLSPGTRINVHSRADVLEAKKFNV